jgi:DNA-binding CsgD family transcriptional regulator
LEVLKLVVAGMQNKEIADKLFISVHTVVSHRKNISQKTGIKSQAGLTIYAISNKVIDIVDFSR